MDSQEFDEIFSHYKSIKEKRADEQLDFYSGKVLSKRRFAQWSGATILVIV